MKRFKEIVNTIKEGVEMFCGGLKDEISDIKTIKMPLKWKIIFCSVFTFVIFSFIYPPIFIFTIALLCWLAIVSIPIIIIGGIVLFGSLYIIYNLIETRYPYLGALLSGIFSIVFIVCGIYTICSWVLPDAFSVLGQIIIDIF